MTARLAISWGLPALALLMLALTLTPAEVWSAPENDAVYNGFDPNLVYLNPGGNGSVHVSADRIDLAGDRGSAPSVDLATTLLQKLTVSVDVTVLHNTAAQPLRIGVWSPWTGSGGFLVFGPAPQNQISRDIVTGGSPGPTLQGGVVSTSTPLGTYQLGSSYRVSIVIDKPSQKIREDVSGPGVDSSTALSSTDSPSFFSNVQTTVTASSVAGDGVVDLTLTNFALVIPHQRSWASRVADPFVHFALVVLSILGGVLLLAAVAMHLPRQPAIWLVSCVQTIRGVIRSRSSLAWVVAPIGLYLVGNALLFSLGSHPFDMSDEKLYLYVARAYGPANLYFLPNSVSLASIWDGIPYIESAFPYGPVFAYLAGALGWLGGILFASGGAIHLDDVRLEYLIKSVNVLFGLADGALIYAILRQVSVNKRWSLIGAALFLFNPAVWFSMSVWGQTHVISLFLVLIAVLLAERGFATWAWMALTAACLTRPQMLVFGLVLGIVFLRKFSWRENVEALSWTMVVTFLATVPLTLATSPSLPIDVMLNNFRVQEASGNAAALTTVSQDAYSVWPLITYIVHGASGATRAFTPSSTPLLGSLSYQNVSQIVTVVAMLAVGVALWTRKRATMSAGGYLPLVALGVASFLMLLTGIVATHFLLALPFLVLCRRWIGTPGYFFVVIAWTVSTFVPMYGDMGAGLSAQGYPLLAPVHNAITRFFVQLYASDRFITVSVVANICALTWLAFVAVNSAFRREGVPARA